MGLSAGTRLGPYEIVALLGAGGMGEVYRARDTRLHRLVAIKILPDQFALDRERIQRFHQEARIIAALNHPNLLALYDFGSIDSTTYLVSEYLEGATLRGILVGGALPLRRVLNYATQIAQGLSAAHDQGIVHRDLKPENVFITKDERLKILDFGLAKLVVHKPDSATMTGVATTNPGLVVGTIGYMSPEQIRGEEIDGRTDIFAFGSIVYEMLSGKRAFRGNSGPETMAAILKDDPTPLTVLNEAVPPGLDSVLNRCLEKNPQRRFQSAKDLAFALEAISGGTSKSAERLPPKRLQWRMSSLAIGVVAMLLVGLVAAFFYATRAGKSGQPSFTRLTRARGWLGLARFVGDGNTVVFSAAWNGEPTRVFFQGAGGFDFSPLPLGDKTRLLSVSKSGELALSLNSVGSSFWTSKGTLSTASLSGGTPRQILENVEEADWSPDGTTLAIVRRIGQHSRLEFPVGKVLSETSGYISHIRFSPSGNDIAFMDHPLLNDNRGTVAVVDLAGRKRTLTQTFGSEMGVVWSPRGDEIWFGAEIGDERYALRAVDLAGHERVLLRAPADLFPQDVSRTGQLLLTTDETRSDIFANSGSGKAEKDLTVFDASWVQEISAHGDFIIFNAGDYDIYMRKTDGSPATKLGRGQVQEISPDGKSLLSILPPDDHKLHIIPSGAGEEQTLTAGKLHYYSAGWLGDSKHVLTNAFDESGVLRAYSQEVPGGALMPVSPSGVAAVLGSPDGKSFLGVTTDKRYSTYSLDRGTTREVSGIAPDERVIQWLADNRTLLVRDRFVLPASVYEMDVITGRRKIWKQFNGADKVGLTGIPFINITRDRSAYVYAPTHEFSVLYSVQGIK